MVCKEMLTIGGKDAMAVRDPRAVRQLSLEALEALVADAAAALAVLQAVLSAKLLDVNAASAEPGMPTDQAEDRLLTLAQARELLQVRHLPADLPMVRLSRKRVRVRLGDLRAYTEQHRLLGQQRVAPQVYNLYSTPMTGKELRKIRTRRKLTQKDLAARIGVTTTSLARWERGEVGISEPVARLVRMLAQSHPPRRREK